MERIIGVARRDPDAPSFGFRRNLHTDVALDLTRICKSLSKKRLWMGQEIVAGRGNVSPSWGLRLLVQKFLGVGREVSLDELFFVLLIVRHA